MTSGRRPAELPPTRAQGTAPAGKLGEHLRVTLPEHVWVSMAVDLSLSRRELQIVQLVCRDDSEEDIASALGISRHTVHTYLDRLYRKLGVGSRAQLISVLFAAYVKMSPTAAED